MKIGDILISRIIYLHPQLGSFYQVVKITDKRVYIHPIENKMIKTEISTYLFPFPVRDSFVTQFKPIYFKYDGIGTKNIRVTKDMYCDVYEGKVFEPNFQIGYMKVD